MAHLSLCLLLALVPSALSENGISGLRSLNFSSSSPHIFSSSFGLLQQWPNTFFPYGHTIAPCEIPINTNLYHARMDGDLPPSPEWFAFDVEMSYAIAGTLDTSHMLTYKTTKVVKCLYFDGASAALNGAGNMDTQMVFIHNNTANIPDDPPFGRRPPTNNRTSGDPNGGFLGAEYDRADGLCSYIKNRNLGGRGWGYEGIVRMNAGFELIWCDFESPSARLISHLNVSVPVMDSQPSFQPSVLELDRSSVAQGGQRALLAADRPPSRSTPRRGGNFWSSAHLGWLSASVNRYGFAGGIPGRGEARVKIGSCSIFSFYDSGLASQERSRVVEEQKLLNLSSSGSWQAPDDEAGRQKGLQELMRRRRSHRADNVSFSDGIYMHEAIEQRLRAFLSPQEGQCSGVEWQLVMQEITLMYSANLHGLLELLQHVPANLDNRSGETLKWLSPISKVAHMLAMPYYEYPSLESIERSPARAFGLSTQQAQNAFSLCREQYSPVSPSQLADFELLLYQATMDVTTEICRVVLTTFLSVETLWYTASGSPSKSSTFSEIRINETARDWRQGLEELTAWLGWADQWTSCKPGCGLGEICVIPMWPISFMGSQGRAGQKRPQDRGPSPPRNEYGSRPGYGYGPHPGYGHGPGRGGRYGRPGGGFGRDEEGLWEPHCMNRTETLLVQD